MNKSCAKIPKLVLISYLVGFMGLSPAFSKPEEVKLRGSIDDALPGIQLKGGINIDKNKQIISLNLRDSDIKQVLRMIADKAGMNIVFHDSVTGKITLDLVNVSLNKAFEYVMTMHGLTYWQDNNTIVIASKTVANGLSINKTQLKPIQIKYVNADIVANFLNTNIFSMNKPEISVNQVAISNPRTNQVLIFGNDNDIALAKKAIELIDVKPLMKTFDVNYADPEVVASSICSTVFNEQISGRVEGTNSNVTTSSSSAGSGAPTAGNSGTMGGGTRIVCSSSANNVSSGGSNFSSSGTEGGFSGIASNQQSVQINGYTVMVNLDLNQITVSGSQDQITFADNLIKTFDKKQPQVYIEISIIELSESGSKTLESTLLANNRHSNIKVSGTGTRLEYTDRRLDLIDGIFTNMGNYGGGFGLFAATIDTLITQQKGRVLANPRIIATNNKPSVINISSDFIAKRTIDRSTTGNTISNLITYEVGQSGISLSITPKISPNGYVTLNLVPSYTSQKEQVKDGADIVATLLNRRDLNLQNIRIKDGQTLVFGGLIQENDSNGNTKVPVLGDLPIVGPLFRSSNTDKSRSELILMITPRILKEEDSSASSV